jgi:RNA-directed DNA polymerase
MAKGGSGLAAPVWKARRSPLNSGAPWPTPKLAEARVLGIQRKLHKWASDDQQRGFSDLHNLVFDPATLMVAWRRVRGNRGSRSAGIDGQTAYEIETRHGVERFLGELREELRTGTFRPLAVKERAIPKRGGKLRYLGIPTVRDRVVQAALKLVLEPIFEADFQPCSYGFRPGRRTQDAIAEVQHFTFRSYGWVVEGDIEACFDRIDHTALMSRVRGRIEDKRVLRLIKAFLHAGILKQHGGFERSVTGTPQGGILSPLLASAPWTSTSPGRGRRWATSVSATAPASAARRPTGSSDTPMTSSSASLATGDTPRRWSPKLRRSCARSG